MKKILNEYTWVLFSPLLLAVFLIVIFTIFRMENDRTYWNCKKECAKIYPFKGLSTSTDFVSKRELCKEKCFNRIILKEEK